MSAIGDFIAYQILKAADLNLKLNGLQDGSLDADSNKLSLLRSQFPNFIEAPGVAVTVTGGLNVTVSAFNDMTNGGRYTHSSTALTLPASKDVYIDVVANGSVVTVPVANGATSGMNLTSNAQRIAMVPTGASSIVSGNIQTSGFDPLGNRINNIDPFAKRLGFKQTTNTSSTNAGATSWNYLNFLNAGMPIICDGIRPVKIKLYLPSIKYDVANQKVYVGLFDGGPASSALLNYAEHAQATTTFNEDHLVVEYEGVLSQGTHTIYAGVKTSTASGTVTVAANVEATAFGFMKAEFA